MNGVRIYASAKGDDISFLQQIYLDHIRNHP